MRLYETPPTLLNSINKQYEIGIVLAGVASQNKELNDRVYVNSSADRVNHSLLLYKKGIIKKILISGGSGKLLNPDMSEANQLFTLFTLMGVDSSDILIERESRNTHESAVADVEILKKITNSSSTLLITSAFHMPRSIACFKKQGWTCDTFSTDIRSHKREFTPDVLIFPKVEAIATWNTLFKEWFGLLAYWISGYI